MSEAQAETPSRAVETEAPRALAGRAVSAAVWLLTGFGGSQILRLVGNVILTRLLFAEAFGVMQLVTVFLIGLHLFSDIGIGPGVVQNPKGDDPAFLDTAWSIQIVRGLALFAVGAALSYPFASYYGDMQMFPILLAANTVSIFGGFQSTKIFTASRHLAQRRLSLLELSAQGVSLVATVVCAYTFRTVWTLVVGGLVYDLLRTMGSHVLLPGHANRFRIDRGHAREMLTFGRWIFLSTVLTFFVSQADRLVFGKLVPLAMLGVYGIAANIAGIAPAALNMLAHNLLFPVYARIVHTDGDLPGFFAKVRRPMLVVAAWAMAGFVAGGPAAVDLLYDARYREGGLLVQILSLGAFVSVLESTTGKALLALGESRFMAASSAGKLVAMVVMIPVGHHLGGFVGACMGYAASELGRYAVSAYAASRRGLHAVGQDLGLLAWVILAGGAGYGAMWLVGAYVTENAIVRALAVFAVVTGLFAPMMRGLLAELRALRQGDVPNADSINA